MIYLLIKSLLLPPGIFVMFGALSIIFYRRLPALSFALLCFTTLLIWAMSTLAVGKYAMRLLEPDKPLLQRDVEHFQPQAIVVLGADRTNSAPEYGGIDQPGSHLLMRLRYSAVVYRRYPLPVLVSGGTGYEGRHMAQAEVMAEVLQQDFQVPVVWQEGRSMTTRENAAYSAEILLQAGIHRVLLVTEAFHMQRAAASFKTAGLCVLPAPTFFLGTTESGLTLRDFVPSAAGLELTGLALHEAIGALYYRMHLFTPRKRSMHTNDLPCQLDFTFEPLELP
jgi:uncharacterized SAM-binding protein YcdF (DUF218 family)